jgi:2-succinyl-5-enolpyruvyl-6-hydroxy-3-cyclohexene-1-carboxylate synthase
MPLSRQGISELPYICLQHGIGHAVISPGSRNAPLIMAFASDPQMKCLSIADERSAGYYALGMALSLQKPVVLVCTSGTAAINFAPAIAEAYYMKIPLLVLTADRPAEWIDQNDGQTIRQNDLYHNYIKKSFQFPVDSLTKEDLWLGRRIISEAIGLSMTGAPGPVHINVPLREPLYTALPAVSEDFAVHEVVSHKRTLSDDQWNALAEKWNSFPKKMVIYGMGSKRDPKLAALTENLARNHKAVVIAENISGLAGECIIDTPESFIASLSPEEKKDLKPDLVITLGSAVVSKRLKKYLREYKPTEHWHVDENDFFIDTYQSLNKNIVVHPAEFLGRMADVGGQNQGYCDLAGKSKEKTKLRMEEFLGRCPFSDMAVYDTLFSQLPENWNVHLANSTPVRYSQLFSSKPGTEYYSSRGTSGIDGCLSTAAGHALASGKPTLAILGDIAFIYDSNGLWNNHLPPHLRVVVIENDGGNIFKLIETGPQIQNITRFFETPHKVNTEFLCKAYGVDYMRAENKEQLTSCLQDFFKPNPRPVVLSIKTSGTESANVYKQFFQFITPKQ